jgi:PAS domain-containing protein
MNPTLASGLMTRASAAETRLRALAQAEGRGDTAAPHVIQHALRELGEALEEVRVAAEHLQVAADDLAVARHEATVHANRYRELYEELPVPCLLTNDEGRVEDANRLASRLLNVGKKYLSGKPLFLYIPQREGFFRIIEQVRESGSATACLSLQPRDRRPVPARVMVTALRHEQRLCWVLGDRNRGDESGVSAEPDTPPADN